MTETKNAGALGAVPDIKDAKFATQIYVSQEDLLSLHKELLASDSVKLRCVDSVALDDGEVHHLHIQPPKAPVYGDKTSAFVAVVSSASAAPASTLCAEIQKSSNLTSKWLLIQMSETKDAPTVTAWLGFSTGTGAGTSTGSVVAAKLSFIPSVAELFSRSKGLLETGVLKDKCVGIVGLGSGGSPVALELTRSGVGRFVLIDFDQLELSNVARHVCDVRDLGRKKTKAVADKVRAINPYAKITTHELNICDDPSAADAALKSCDLIVAGTDNNESRFLLNQISLRHKIPAIYGRVITRGAGGDVVRVRPGHGPCLSCIFTKQFLLSSQEQVTSFKQARAAQPAYVPDEKVDAIVQVGLSCDIAPVTNMIVKLAVVELSRNVAGSGLASLETDLEASLYMWANRREENFAKFAPLKFSFNAPPLTILRWYGLRVAGERCETCTPKEQTEQDKKNAEFF